MDYSAIARDFNDNGFTIARGIFSAAEVAALEMELNRYIREELPRVPAADVYYEDGTAEGATQAIKSVFRLEEHSTIFRDLMTDDRLLAIMGAIFGEADIIPKGSFFFGKAAHSGSVTPAHQDNAFQNLQPPDAVVATVGIDASTPANGALTCQRGSHLVGVLPHRPSGVMGFSQTLIEELDKTAYPEVQLCMQPGDVALHHTNTIHRSDGNTTPFSRRQVGVQYYSSRAKRDEAAWERYQQELQKLRASQAAVS